MLDGADAGSERRLDPGRILGVGEDPVNACQACLLDHHLELLGRELDGPGRIHHRVHAAGRERLDPVGAGADLGAHGLSDLVGPIRDAGWELGERPVPVQDDSRRGHPVTVATGDRDRDGADLEAWSRPAPGEHLAKPGRCAAGVPDRRDPGFKERPAGSEHRSDGFGVRPCQGRLQPLVGTGDRTWSR